MAIKDTPMLFAHQLKAMTQAKPALQAEADNALIQIREVAKCRAALGFAFAQIENGSCFPIIPTNKEVLSLIEKALMADGFTQVIVQSGCVAISWQ